MKSKVIMAVAILIILGSTVLAASKISEKCCCDCAKHCPTMGQDK